MDIREDLNIYMQIIRLLDESVNGYLYACDLQDDRMYFTDKICRRFALPFSGEQGIPFKEWEAVIYDRDVKLIKDDMEETGWAFIGVQRCMRISQESRQSF